MDNKYIEQLRTYVKDALRTDNMRYQHTLGVANTSACLAMFMVQILTRRILQVFYMIVPNVLLMM